MDELDTIDAALIEQIRRGDLAAAEFTLRRRKHVIAKLAGKSPSPAAATLLEQARDRGDQMRRLLEAIRENTRAALGYAATESASTPSRVDYSG